MKRTIQIVKKYTYDGQERYALYVTERGIEGIVAVINDLELAERVKLLLEGEEIAWPTPPRPSAKPTPSSE